MSTASLDADLLATMTPEEREAFDDATPEEIASLQNVSGASKDGATVAEPDDKDDDDAEDEAAEADEAPAAAAAPEAPAEPAPVAAAPAAAPAAPAADPVDDEPAQAPVMSYRFELPADFADRVTANAEAEAKLYEQLKEGDITVDELQAEQRKLLTERRELDSMQMRHDIAQDTQRQAMEAQRNMAVSRLFRAAKGEGIDYRADEPKAKDLDTFVRALAADPKNEDKSLDWFLAEGHKRVRALHGIASAPAAVAAPAAPAPKLTAAEAKAAAAAARTTPVTDVPKTLAQVPGGDGPGDVGGEFDDVLGLEGDAFEQAISEMSKRDPARFARFQSSSQ